MSVEVSRPKGGLDTWKDFNSMKEVMHVYNMDIIRLLQTSSQPLKPLRSMRLNAIQHIKIKILDKEFTKL